MNLKSQSLLYFKDNYKMTYIINSHRYADGFIQQGKYTRADLDVLINIDGYIPVANANELNNIRLTVNQKMGVDTPWEGFYNTGITNSFKYVQIYHIDLVSIPSFLLIPSFAADYDGNETMVSNFNISSADANVGFFGVASGNLSNIRLLGNVTKTSIVVGSCGGITGALSGNATNCHFTGEVISAYPNTGGIAGSMQNITCEINNCCAFGIITGVGKVGGIVGTMNNAANKVVECSTDVVVTSSGNWSALLVGHSIAGIISESHTEGTHNLGSSNSVGGIVGYNQGATISNCYNIGNIKGSVNEGGLVGYNQGNIINSYSLGLVDGGGTLTGGLVGGNVGTITNSYYDSDTSGQSDSGKGIPKTTVEMKAGTPSPSIYTNWLTPPWDFGTTNDYPILF